MRSRTPLIGAAVHGAAATAQTQGTPDANAGPQGLPELAQLYEQVSLRVVNIQVLVNANGAAGEAAGSGFIIDDAGHIC